MATEDRWHDFAKEKPSEDMEGRDFIVSNGHYEKIATWCGYWENEPFMGDRLCDEVVRWKGYLTPEEEKANEATCKELFVEEGYNGAKYYDKDAVDALLAKKDAEIAELKQRLAEKESWVKMLGEGEAALSLELEKTKQKLEDAKASHYAESVDAGMRERRLRRALWLAREWRAWCEGQFWFVINGDEPRDVYHLIVTKRIHRTPTEWIDYWQKVEQKCQAKAEEYK